jgi:hypothetical protein
MEQSVKQLLSCRRRKSIEPIAGSIGKGAPEAQYLLKFCSGI